MTALGASAKSGGRPTGRPKWACGTGLPPSAIYEADQTVGAQLISTRLKPGGEGDPPKVAKQLHAADQPNSGLVRAMITQWTACC
jgi:hypothetical protein